MAPPFAIAYRLEPEDVLEGVRLLFAPSPLMRRMRPVLLATIAVLWTIAGLLIAYLYFFWWRSFCALRPLRLAGTPVSGRAVLPALTAFWAVLGVIALSLRLSPNWALDRICRGIARRILARVAPGPRVLTLRSAGFALTIGDRTHLFGWDAVRRARRTEGFLALSAGQIGVFVPLRRLPPAQRSDLLREAEARADVRVIDLDESSIAL